MKIKEKIWKSFSILIGIVLIVGIVYAIISVKKTNETPQEVSENKQEEKELLSSDYFINPDRVVYKMKKENKYYIFEKDEDSYKEIVNEFCKGVTSKTDGEKLTEKDIEKIKDDEMFIEFDYNQVSKNYVFPLELEGKNMIAMQEEGGQVYLNKIENVDKIKELLEKYVKEKGAVKLEDPRVYTSKNKEKEIKDADEMKKIDDNLYELKIESYDQYKEFVKKHNVKFNENLKIEETTFKQGSVIAVISKYTIDDVTSDVGSIHYTYTGKVDKDTEYTVSLTFVSEVTNSNCIYRNLDKVEVDKTEDKTTKSNNSKKDSKKEITSEEAIEIWKNKKPGYWTGTKVIDNENYNKLDGIEKGDKKPNNLFTKKNAYNELETGPERPVWILHTSHDTHIMESLDIYIDRYTGEIIGGRVYGD